MLFSDSMDDAQLWDGYRAGHEPAFALLYHRFYAILFDYGYRLSADKQLVRESIQNLFVKLWTNRNSVRETGSVKYYLLKSFRRHLTDLLQSRNIYSPGFLSDSPPAQLPHEEVMLVREEAVARQKKVQELMMLLTDRQREAIHLRFFENLSYDEIAAIMNLQVGGTYKLIYRALDRLRQETGACVFFLLYIAE